MGVDHREVRAWLGPAEYTDEHVERIAHAWEVIHNAYPDDDKDGLAVAANGAGAFVLGDATVEQAISRWHQAQVAAAEAQDYLRGVVIAAIEDGAEVKAVANLVGITRKTLYRWIGRDY